MPVVETGESEDVETRVRPHCDGTGLGRAQIWRIGTHSRKQCEIWAQFQPNPLSGKYKAVRGCEHVMLQAPVRGLLQQIPREASSSKGDKQRSFMRVVSVRVKRPTVSLVTQ